MLTAAFVSLSIAHPQVQLCQRSESSFLATVPHPEQIWLVYLGLTCRSVRPAHAALFEQKPTNCPQPASRMLLFNPPFAAAPLGKYSPVASSCFGFGRLLRLAACKSS